MTARTIILCLALPIAGVVGAGCITTDGQGKPIPRQTRGPKPQPIDVAIATATADGSQVVASGKAGAVSFIYPGTGRLTVRDVTANTMPFSVQLTDRDGPATRTLIAIGTDGKLTGTASGENGPVVTELGNLDKAHTFVITYAPAMPSAPSVREAR